MTVVFDRLAFSTVRMNPLDCFWVQADVRCGMTVKSHGIPDEVIQRVVEAGKRYFGQSNEEKMKVRSSFIWKSMFGPLILSSPWVW